MNGGIEKAIRNALWVAGLFGVWLGGILVILGAKLYLEYFK